MNVLPLSQSIPGGVLCSAPSEGSEPVRKKPRLDIDTLPGDDHKPQFDIDISDTRMCEAYLCRSYLFIVNILILHACNPI